MILHERTLILDPDVFSGLTKETLTGLEKMGTMAALQVLKDHMVKALKERRARGRGKIRERGSKRVRGTGKRLGANVSGGPFTNAPLERKPVAGGVGHLDNGASTVKTDEVPPAPPGLVPMDVSGAVQGDVGSPIVVVDDSEDDGPATKRRKVDDVLC